MHSQNSSYYIYGKHSCISAIKNAHLKMLELSITESSYEKYIIRPDIKLPKNLKLNIVPKDQIDKLFKDKVNHQNMALLVIDNNIALDLKYIISNELYPLIILDQVTDIHNIGAIIRNCAAFNIKALITTKRNFPQDLAAINRTSSGTSSMVPIIKVANLEQSIHILQKNNYETYGLDVDTDKLITNFNFASKAAFIFGSEGSGLRDLTKKRCDYLLKIPMNKNVESLNIASAVAVTLYEYNKLTA